MNEIQVFNGQFGSVRTLEENGRVLFCGNDVARALGYTRPKDAILDHCKGAVKRRLPTNGGEQTVAFIPEPDVYRLAFQSKLPGAEKFTDWVTETVLPAIRQTGGYSSDMTAFIVCFCHPRCRRRWDESGGCGGSHPLLTGWKHPSGWKWKR